jgi:RimJ/RimL family protein N-acetyltransferase
MERMPYQEGREATQSATPAPRPAVQRIANWREGLPALGGTLATLRELQTTDAPALLVAMSSENVTGFISPPPSTIGGFERFIAWSHAERAAGRSAAFAIVPHGLDHAIGLFQLRSLDASFGTSEWGFALAVEYWGRGIFFESAELMVDFAFDVLGAHRLEARAALRNGRGNGALRKMGAMQEGVLRRSFLRRGEYLDQALWTILKEEWLPAPGLPH